MWLHRFTKLLAASGFLLIIAGGLVTSTASGLAIPDWPTTYGSPMFAFPYSQWIGGVLYQQAHRLIAAGVASLTLLLTIAYWRKEPRGGVRAIALIALAAVVAQGVLGGLAVRQGLPGPLSNTHSGLAQIFFALVVALSVFTSPGWLNGYEVPGREAESWARLASDRLLRRLAILAIAAVYLQILLGAVVRQAGAAQAIPDYPLAFGRLVPSLDSLTVGVIAVNFAHRLGALAVVGLVGALAWRVIAAHRDRPELVHAATLLVALLAIEVVLGALAITSPAIVARTALVAIGALIFVTSVVLALRVHRPFFGVPVAHGNVGTRGVTRR